MNLIVYHGSDNIIDKPKHNGGRNFSDFGLGFYITTNIDMAKDWASRKKDRPAYVNKYLFNTEGIKSLTFDLDINWILFIAYNRGLILNKELKELLQEKYKNLNEYDIIVGPTVDDRMFDTLNMFFSNTITLEHCLQSLNSMDLDIQYNVKSSEGINALLHIKKIELDDIDKEYYASEIKAKKDIMNKKMKFIRQKYGKIGKYFDEIEEVDISG
ncbi:DUF3990 domain-containing protein [Clostridium gasigenes]|uniref:DUF3990 domain-containing protein n=1 Tax=Clostridium gasigenes TaxID=94869 RepID=A0A7X0VQ02_9CLOT|nr:DUF3990 domain-containing protein [Clostridium gasigenes]MBB6713478.1 DUF3990 domain-containing protein [Clostridium gasigenes]